MVEPISRGTPNEEAAAKGRKIRALLEQLKSKPEPKLTEELRGLVPVSPYDNLGHSYSSKAGGVLGRNGIRGFEPFTKLASLEGVEIRLAAYAAGVRTDDFDIQFSDAMNVNEAVLIRLSVELPKSPLDNPLVQRVCEGSPSYFAIRGVEIVDAKIGAIKALIEFYDRKEEPYRPETAHVRWD